MKSGILTYPVALGGKHRVWENYFKKFVAVVSVALVVALGWVTVDRAALTSKRNSDFTVYTAAGRAVLDGADIYQAHNSRGMYYVYPPPFAIVAVGLELLPAFWGPLLWYALGVALTAWSVKMCVSLASETGRPSNTFWLYALAALSVSPWFVQAAAEGQATMLLAWLIVAALYWQKSGRPWIGGACLAGAVLLKVFPVVLLGYFALRRQWQFLAACLIALLLGAFVFPTTIFGWQRTAEYWREWVSVIAGPALGSAQVRQHNQVNAQLLSAHKSCNQTLPAVFWRLTGDLHSRKTAAVAGLAMAAVMIVTGWKSHREAPMAAAALLWMLLVPPTSEFHYYLVSLLPMTILIVLAVNGKDVTLRILSSVTLIVFAAASLLTLGFRSLQELGLLCGATVGLWGVMLLAALRPPRPSLE